MYACAHTLVVPGSANIASHFSPGCARRESVDPGVVGIDQCVNRWVRQAFLCGWDMLTGRSFEHRRAGIRQRLETLAGLFALNPLGLSLMPNNFSWCCASGLTWPAPGTTSKWPAGMPLVAILSSAAARAGPAR